jgi:CO/xanthine dehydrogenase FAD-binding subunit
MVVGQAGGRCAAARLVTAGAGPVPVRLRAAEEILERDGLSVTAVEAAARRAAELVDPPSDIHASADYRRNLTRVLTGRALRRAIARLDVLSPTAGERAG